MAMDEETGLYGIGEGCAIHGDEHMRECSMCGAEFCTKCFPRSAVCEDCAESGGDEDDPDFEDVSDLKEVLDDDEEADRLAEESEAGLAAEPEPAESKPPAPKRRRKR